ncbi:MAG: NAD(P)(+) transhydrogenase (Re/Si-specific) subunit beta [Rickettsiaceae bacterium]|nr:NAD(P)(+) transhydrogenase (Re/Si-specific) subunit beta [Rickettsiaceae bacterium]
MTNIDELLYLIAGLCFIFSIKGLSSHKESKIGSWAGIIGMAISLLTCLFVNKFSNQTLAITSILSGGVVGAVIATKIQMTSMPQLVAGFHSLVGLSAVLVAYGAYFSPEALGIAVQGTIKTTSAIEMSIGAAIGAVTFTGSIIAYAKLEGLITSNIIKFRGQRIISLALLILLISSLYLFINSQSLFYLNLLVFSSLALGILLILPVGGADMPVVVSMLNSYSGWAASGIGFTLNSKLLVITGALVGASGAILSYIMCNAMNRSLFTVIFGAFMNNSMASESKLEDDRQVNKSSPEDAAFMLKNAANVIIVPGYGMAVAQAQHALKELVDILQHAGIDVKFAIHPVAGRMPGHMNVLLAEANIPYEIVLELEDINRDFISTDVAIVIGANDVTNPAAKNDKTSPIYGMPILEVENSRNVFFIKRSMGKGYAGIENELFYKPNTHMLFGDAKKVVDEIVKSIKEL